MGQISLAPRILALGTAIGLLASCASSRLGTAPPTGGVLPVAQIRSATQGDRSQLDPPEVTVAPSSLTFTVGGAPQTFTATAEDAHAMNASTSDITCAIVSPASAKPTRIETPDTNRHEGDKDVFRATFTVTPVGAGNCMIAVTGKHDKDQGASLGIGVVAAPAQFVYVANSNDSTISAFAVNAASGALTPVAGSPFQASNSPLRVTADPNGKFLYSSDFYGGVAAFTINAPDGVLTPVAGSPFGAGGNPRGVAVDATVRFAYVANEADDTVTAYSINATSGALTATGTPFGAGPGPFFVTVDPSGKFAYVADNNREYYYSSNPGTVSAFTINASNGALTPVAGSPFAAGAGPWAVTVGPNGKFVYVANHSDNGAPGNVSAYAINASSGALTPVPGSPFAAGITPQFVALNPAGTFAYVPNGGNNNVSAYTINATTGAMTPLLGSPFAAGTDPIAVVVDATSKFAFVANNGSASVSAYSINAATGVLTPVPGSPFAAGNAPWGIAVTHRH